MPIINSHNVATFEDYCEAMKRVISKEMNLKIEDIKLDVNGCKYWYENGFPPYYAFRESMTESDSDI